MIKFFFVLLLLTCSAFAQKKAASPEYGTESGIDFRVFKKTGRYLLLAETRNRDELSGDYHQVLLGSYYRLTKRFRMGAFLQAEEGLRWDEDWVNEDGWKWQDHDSRWDFSSVLDATYNDVFNSNWVWEFKTRLYYYHAREALQLRLRPGIRYFIMKFGKPLWQIYSELEAYVPLNYGENFLYEYWLYLGTLYQFTDKFALGPVVSFRERWFHSYNDFEARTGQSFKTVFQSTYLGINAVYLW